MSGVRVSFMRVVESVWVVFTFIPRVDFMLSRVNGLHFIAKGSKTVGSTVVLALLVLGGRTSRASLLSVISMVSAFMGMGFRWVSMRSVCTVAIGFDAPQEHNIRSRE